MAARFLRPVRSSRSCSLAIAALTALFGAGCQVEEKTPTFTEINEQILKPNCTFACHSGGPGIAAGNLDLELDAYGVLVGQAATSDECKTSALQRVTAGEPEQSLLYEMSAAKRDGVESPCGGTMPLGEDRPALSASDLEQVRLWIAAGAPKN